MTPRLMNTGLASHLILAGNTLKKKPDTCSLEEHHQRFYPRDTYYRANAGLWLVSLNHPWPLIGQEKDGWWRRFLTGHRSSFTPILDTRVRFPLHKPSLSLSTLTIPLLQKCRPASFRFMNHFSMKMIELQTRGIQFELKDYRTHFILQSTILL